MFDGGSLASLSQGFGSDKIFMGAVNLDNIALDLFPSLLVDCNGGL